MSIPVEAGFLHSIRSQASFTWKKMLCELIDNAFDANANTVNVAFPGGRVFRIQDDGSGTDDLMRLVTLGQRKEHMTNDIGKYGVGSTLALVWLWGTSILESKTEDRSQRVEMHWSQIADGLSQYPQAAEECSVASINGTGTRIECRSERGYPKIPALIQSLTSTYTPGLELGKTIAVKTENGRAERVRPRQWPKVTKEINDVIEAAGRPVRIRMGIVAEGSRNPYGEGFSFERTYRVIKESTLGANGFAVSRVAARVTLGGEWELSTNKDDFSEFQDELAEAIYARCYDLLSEASEQAVSLEDDTFNKELARIVQECANDRKRERRDSDGSQSGSVEPKNTGRRRERAAKITDNPGSVIDGDAKRSRRRGFTVETYEDASGSLTFGRYDPDGNRVRLNVANPWLHEMHRSRNANATLPVIYGILAEATHRSQSERVPLFTDQLEDQISQWGTAVAAAAVREGLM